jgi:Flp pilus assembly pilin Flp
MVWRPEASLHLAQTRSLGARRGVSASEGKDMSKIYVFVAEESGASAAEYALVLAFVVAVIVAGLALLGNQINATIRGHR